VQRAAAPCNEGCVTLARIGEDAWAMGDSKQPDAAGIDPVRFGLNCVPRSTPRLEASRN
jgi:hypothetical protein